MIRRNEATLKCENWNCYFNTHSGRSGSKDGMCRKEDIDRREKTLILVGCREQRVRTDDDNPELWLICEAMLGKRRAVSCVSSILAQAETKDEIFFKLDIMGIRRPNSILLRQTDFSLPPSIPLYSRLTREYGGDLSSALSYHSTLCPYVNVLGVWKLKRY